jgi:hypothetical protein
MKGVIAMILSTIFVVAVTLSVERPERPGHLAEEARQ